MTLRRFRLPLLLLAFLCIALVALVAFLPRIELASFAASRATASLGRQVEIASLRVTPGRWLHVEVAGLRVANAPGGSRPSMVSLGQAQAEVALMSLVRGAPVVRGAAVEGLSILLERVNGTPNWHGSHPSPPATGPRDLSWFPALLDVAISGSDLTFLTTQHATLITKITQARIASTGADQPVTLHVEGAYNDTPITLQAGLDPVTVLRQAGTPFGTRLHFLAGGDTVLDFDGSMTDPLNVDGATGQVKLRAPSLATLSRIAGVAPIAEMPLELAGKMERQGNLWRLTEAQGAFAGAPLQVALLELTEGGTGQPDALRVDATLARLQVDPFLGTGGGGTPDFSGLVSGVPDPSLDLRIAVGALSYADYRAEQVALVAAMAPNRTTIESLTLNMLGGRMEGSAQAELRADGAHLEAALSATQTDVDAARRAFGMRSVPVSGRMDGRFAVANTASTIDAAVQNARVTGVVAMRQGRIAREVIEMASTDLRALLRDAEGTTPLACLLAVVHWQAGTGDVALLRLRSAEGTIAGTAGFNLRAQQMDLVIGSESATTGSFALDIPMRVSGSFASPSIRPARWSPEGRARMAASADISTLPPPLRQLARESGCVAGR